VLWHQASATDLLFITLRKSEALFSPSTRYRDLALGPSLSGHGISSGPDQLQLAERSASKAAAHPGNGSR
jgi:hypothetical protein